MLAEIARRVWAPDERLVEQLARTDGDVVVLGAAGKMGVSLSRMAAAALEALPGNRRVFGVSRFADAGARDELDSCGVTTIAADMFDESALAALPDAANVVFMAGRKFGTGTDAGATWATNVLLPSSVAQRYRSANVVAFSSGNVYRMQGAFTGGADETSPVDPVGEYAQSCLGRERILSYWSEKYDVRMTIVRLNYAVDCRYGVLTDIAKTIMTGQPVDLSTGVVNVVWQGDANRYALSGLAITESPPRILNVTGPETASVRWLAEELGRRLGREVTFSGTPADTALLSNASRCFGEFGYPQVTLAQMLDWTAAWLVQGGRLLDKPTHFAERSGRF